MKTIFIKSPIVVLLYIVFFSCDDNSNKSDPIIETLSATATGPYAAIVSGRINALNNSEYGNYGFCFSLHSEPSVEDSVLCIGNAPSDTGNFTGMLADLKSSTTYYVRTYIIIDSNYEYGKVIKFTTDKAKLPSVITLSIQEYTQTTAVGRGYVIDDAGSVITMRGICWSTLHQPSFADSHTSNGTGIGEFTGLISNLTPNTVYYLRAYAANSEDTVYGYEKSLTTLSLTTPTVTTYNSTNIDSVSALCNGFISLDGGSSITERGFCWSTSPNPSYANDHISSGSDTGAFSINITGLNKNTLYYVKAYARNGIGIRYGNEVFFRTWSLPFITTTSPTDKDSTSVTCGGNITSDGGLPVTDRGICWSTTPNPTIADNHLSGGIGVGIFSIRINDLIKQTKYYLKAYSINEIGVGYGSEISFVTLGTGTVTDIDGNFYHTITIGNQVWMTENLKTTHYQNGVSIELIYNSTTWINDTIGAFCYYNNNPGYSETYGHLYNWYAINNSNRIAPAGWRVPTDGDWATLVNSAGGEVAGLKLKATYGWDAGGNGSDNYGFTALPGGNREIADFRGIGISGCWWSSTICNENTFLAWFYAMYSHVTGVHRNGQYKESGLSVRCVKY